MHRDADRLELSRARSALNHISAETGRIFTSVFISLSNSGVPTWTQPTPEQLLQSLNLSRLLAYVFTSLPICCKKHMFVFAFQIQLYCPSPHALFYRNFFSFIVLYCN